MKKIILSLVALCAFVLVSCGNAAMAEIETAVKTAISNTEAATTIEEVAAAGVALDAEMARINTEAGGKIGLTGDVEELTKKYEEVAKAKLAELGVQL